jgi:hypothetical protein
MSYEQKHIDIPRRFTSDKIKDVAFYGDRVVATDSFRLIEILASGEAHEAICFDATMLKAVKIPKGYSKSEEEFGLVPSKETYPKWQELKDDFDKQEYVEFFVNGDYLAEIVSQFAKLSKHKQVSIQVPKKYFEKEAHVVAKPIKIKAPDATAYLMPMNNYVK